MLYALLGAVAIGLVLGLLGSGGSILTVPVLVYLAGEPGKVAIAESLAIVGAIAAVGVLPYARQKLVDWHSVLYFGVPGIVGAYGGATLAQWVPGPAQLTLFAVVMLAAAVMMFRGRRDAAGEAPPAPTWQVAAMGLGVGVMTGLVGVGGGFLIVPALFLLVRLPLRRAVGTSLSIIVLNSAAGFVKYQGTLGGAGIRLDWRLIGLFAAIGMVGSLAGNALGGRVPQAQLKRGFAVFLVLMGVFILFKEAPRAFGAPAAVAAASAPPASGAPLPPLSPAPMSFFSRFFSPSAPAADSRLAPGAFVASRDPQAPVLDVRTAAEFAGGHLKGALNVDVNAPDFKDRVAALAKKGVLAADRPVYVYCRSGNRSSVATGVLRQMGYGQAVNVGGFEALRAAGAAVGR